MGLWLKTFADQAAIAIENVRLFNETKEALEQQTATGRDPEGHLAALQPTVQPVFDAIVRSGRPPVRALLLGNVLRYDGGMLEMVA